MFAVLNTLNNKTLFNHEVVVKILHVLLTRMPVPPLKYGGTERVVWALYKGQKELGHEVKFLTKHQSIHPNALLYTQKRLLKSK